jgi:hypothetical protein
VLAFYNCNEIVRWRNTRGFLGALPVEFHVLPLLLQGLVDAGDHDAVRLATAMPYWPIGLDAQGQWC